MPISVVTLKDHHYGSRRKTGDVYEVPGRSVLQLVTAMGWAQEREAPAAAAPAPISTAALTAASAKPAAKRAARKTAANYLTRDMAAQPAADLVTRDPVEPAAPETPEAPPAAPDAAQE